MIITEIIIRKRDKTKNIEEKEETEENQDKTDKINKRKNVVDKGIVNKKWLLKEQKFKGTKDKRNER